MKMKPDRAPQYTNPVIRRACPDPFVLKHQGEYWGYCTGAWRDGRYFGILHSPDLVHWMDVGGALEPLDAEATCYWAPEVVFLDGRFIMYYSVGDEEHMHIRAAVAEHPQGPFVDSGQRLTSEKFAIDPHVFEDEDGSRYLFYATDFLDHTHIGTGTMRDRLLDPFSLAGRPRPVTRARYNWQVYDPQRIEKGGVRWHTLEGPFVLKHKGLYYQMFSGGNWKDPSYGVCYAVSPRPDPEGEWEQVCDGEQVLPVLRSLPERDVIGPGHNSVVYGPDNRQLFCVYHRWISTVEAPGTESQAASPAAESHEPVPGRVMAIDRLEWLGQRLAVLGPSASPQPAPLPPTLQDFTSRSAEHETGLGEAWACRGGPWSLQGGMARQDTTRPGLMSEALLALPASSFLLQTGLQALNPDQRLPGAYGLLLEGEEGEIFALVLLPKTGGRFATTGQVVTGYGEARRDFYLDLPHDFRYAVLHQVRLEVNGLWASLSLDGRVYWRGRIPAPPTRVGLFTRGMAAGFTGFELTAGWEDQFIPLPPGAPEERSLSGLGWETGDEAAWEVRGQELWCPHPADAPAVIVKGPLLDAYEFVANARLAQAQEEGGYGFFPALDAAGEGPCFRLSRRGEQWVLDAGGAQPSLELPQGFDPAHYQQFRFWKQGGQITVWLAAQWDMLKLGQIPVQPGPSRVGLCVHRAAASFDMLRVTAIPA